MKENDWGVEGDWDSSSDECSLTFTLNCSITTSWVRSLELKLGKEKQDWHVDMSERDE